MATFPNIEASFPVRKTSKPIAKTVVFADGYQHRIIFGLPQNQNPKSFIFTWKNLSEQDSDTIETFLDARANDQDSFDYTPYNESSSMKFICRSWSKSMDFPNLASINATFEQVFEP